MEFWGSDPDEPPAPLPPPPPPPLWLQQPPPPPPPQPQSSHCDFTEQRTTRVGCRNSGLGLDNDYLNNVVYVGQGVGRRATENFPIFDNIHKEIQRDGDLENETRKTGCTNPGFGSRQNVAYFGQGTGRANENVDMLYNVNPETQRDVEKEKIRKEIIAAEMAMRRELEAEVREELRIERELALRMEGGNAFDKVGVPMDTRGKSLVQEAKGLSLEEKLATHAAKLQIQGRTETNKMDLLPSHRTSLESKVNETHQEEAKALVSAKRGGYTVHGVWGVGNIAGKIDWRCFICQVSATSEADLKQHFNGNKHKSKRAALKAEKSATTTELQVGGKAVHISQSEPTPLPIASAKYLDGNGSRSPSITGLGAHSKLQVGGNASHVSRIKPSQPMPSALVASKPLDGNTVSMLPEKNKAKGSEKFAFWCDMCNAGANNKHLMEAHKKGKKHLNQLQKKFPFWCDICKVGAHQANIMEAHLIGMKHLSSLQEKTGKAN